VIATIPRQIPLLHGDLTLNALIYGLLSAVAGITLVLVGADANATHADSAQIGSRNWIWWEIERSKLEGNGLIAVKIQNENPTPDPLYGAGAKWAMSFTQEAILNAVNQA